MCYPPELIDLPFGAYATKVNIDGVYYDSVTNFGIKPTVSSENFCTLETHILNFDEDIYGKQITVEFVKMIRKEQKFASVNELKIQIEKDIVEVYN